MTVKVTLSPMETKVLRCISRGLSDKEISAKVGIPVRNVKYYAQKLHMKIGNEFASPRVSLVIWAYENRFVIPGRKDR